MPGLDPRHPSRFERLFARRMGCRVKPGNDEAGALLDLGIMAWFALV